MTDIVTLRKLGKSLVLRWRGIEILDQTKFEMPVKYSDVCLGNKINEFRREIRIKDIY